MQVFTKSCVKQEAQKIDATKFLSYRDYLKALYSSVKSLLVSYSYLQFAEDLGFSKTNVIRLVIAGKRPLTPKAASKIAVSTGMKGAGRRYWTALVKYNNCRIPVDRDKLFEQLMEFRSKLLPTDLDQTQMEYFSDWYSPVIAEMVGLDDFVGDPEWIKERLSFPLRLEQIKKSLEVLERLDIISFDSETKQYNKVEKRIATDAEVDNMAIVRFHQKMIEMAKESVTTVDEDERDIKALTVSLPKSAVPILKGKIYEWLTEILEMEENAKSSDEVYQVNVQLFPFTKK